MLFFPFTVPLQSLSHKPSKHLSPQTYGLSFNPDLQPQRWRSSFGCKPQTLSPAPLPTLARCSPRDLRISADKPSSSRDSQASSADWALVERDMGAWQEPSPPRLAATPALLASSQRIGRRESCEVVGDYLTAKCTVGRPRWTSGLWSAVMPGLC